MTIMESLKPINLPDNLLHYLTDSKLINCQKEIGYTFKDPTYLLEALWHSSYKEIGTFSYERLEFLGDTILQYITGIYLYSNFPNEDEGYLTKKRSTIVSAKALSKVAKEYHLDQFIFIDDYLKNKMSNSILCDLYESITAAIFSDGGLEPCKIFVMKSLKNIISAPLSDHQNFKSQLQELLQKNHSPIPIYQVINEKGPHHEIIFEMILELENKTYGPIQAKSKKEGEQLLAQLAIKSLG
ncbi:MAG: ribonuclease III [Planctomycetota bacterium]|nr:MAG: ribonuclease III [Planctomycetota bacterium]